jgi:hypothetical protein
MKKISFVIMLFAVILSGCSTPQPKPMKAEYWAFVQPVVFSPVNLLSDDNAIRAKAEDDYNALTADSKEKVLTYIAYSLADEKEAETRHKIFDTLREHKAGGFIIAPLVKAYGANGADTARNEIEEFINEYRPAQFGMEGLRGLLKERDLQTRLAAIRLLSEMKDSAAPAFPEIIGVMRDTGPRYGVYSEIYNYAAEINADAALAAVSLDLENASPYIRESALRKMKGIYLPEIIKPKHQEIAFRCIVRAMYGQDAELSKTAREILMDTGWEEALTAVHDFDGIPKMKVQSMKELTIKKLKERFAAERSDDMLTLKFFLQKAGRPDAADALK